MATPVIMPRQGQSVESCILTEWKVAPGDQVEEGSVLAVIETDKASFDLESPVAGTVLDLFWEADDDVPVLANVTVIGDEGEDASGFRPVTEAASSGPSVDSTSSPAISETSVPAASVGTVASPVSAAEGSVAGVSPRARQLAMRSGIDPDSLLGTGPGGRVIERDVQGALEGTPRLSASASALAREGGLEPPVHGGGLSGMALASDMREPGSIDGAEVVPVKGIRKVIADRMMQSLGNTAQLTLHAAFDVTAAQAFRKARKESGEPKVSLNDVISHALIHTLLRHPDLNAHFLGDRIARFEKVSLGTAVDTDRGLMVPVLSKACCLSLDNLSAGIRGLAEECREGTIQPDQLTGGTFTLTNLGMLGVEHFTPVLNIPEVAILGVGGISIRPVRGETGEVNFVDSIALSLTMDHQAIDGAPAARFLKDLVETLENYSGDPAANKIGESSK
ncbi:MAG: dihydrolipoamide acetyltransferase family protein [Verrucomicrobia bacterium]|nr:2-oxo acid dehydrogenase subunit E2 [Verrucomicrobiota bacterium]MDA1047474.1 dihydrolipoamide acetyltransferase family protein [Verrucomicrobiota bacterium]